MYKPLIKLLSLKKIFTVTIVIFGCWQFGSGTYILAKAQLAQYLLGNAWSKTLEGETNVKPWTWADTYPVAKLTFHNQHKEYIVLAGATGRTMAFGPGHLSATPLPGDGGNSVIIGHRDTHFASLKNLEQDDFIQVQLPNQQLTYQVFDIFVVDKNQSEVMTDQGQELITLITCFPFNALQPGSPLRYVVKAKLI